MKKFNSLLLSMLIAMPLGVSADDASGNFAIRGAGLIDCKTYVQEKEQQTKAFLMIGGYIDGYLTAYNQLSEDTYDITSYQSTEMLAKVIENHCVSNPEHRLFTVVSSIANQLRDDRVSERTEMINILVDGKSTRLYAETIRRMQSKLKAAKFYQEEVSGQFTAGTLESLKSYQESVGYSPTGFPDQATLWKLFAE